MEKSRANLLKMFQNLISVPDIRNPRAGAVCLLAESDCWGYRGLPGLPVGHANALGVYSPRVRGRGACSGFRGDLFQENGTRVCGCDMRAGDMALLSICATIRCFPSQ